jgi:hypothetical protein
VGPINHRFKIDKLDAADDRSGVSPIRPTERGSKIHPSGARTTWE